VWFSLTNSLFKRVVEHSSPQVKRRYTRHPPSPERTIYVAPPSNIPVDEKPLWAVPVVSVAAIFRRMQNDARKQCGHVQKQLVVKLD
jgi:hypothetical protein